MKAVDDHRQHALQHDPDMGQGVSVNAWDAEKTRRDILHIIATEGHRLGASNSFMGADQSKAGRNGHLKAMLTHE